ncbi:MAG TPA: hypothetical protein VJS67_03500 [Pseudonocardiaceae bacterium]|nr:hypothetical protein [Pseudonocardiaceae bacterium]
MLRAKSDDAIAFLRDAVTKEDQTAYGEPSDCFPVRHVLRAQLLKTGQVTEAAAGYRKDLELHPNNGWALYGLTQALTKQRNDPDTDQTEQRFRQAWRNADVTLVASAF